MISLGKRTNPQEISSGMVIQKTKRYKEDQLNYCKQYDELINLNAEKLQKKYPQKEKLILMGLLEDFDNNVDMADKILAKESVKSDGRIIRKILPILKENQPSSDQDCQQTTEELVQSLHNQMTIQEMYQKFNAILQNYRNKLLEKQTQVQMENKLLKRAFLKQFNRSYGLQQQVYDLAKQNEQLTESLKHEKETNYMLLFQLQSVENPMLSGKRFIF